MPALSAEEPVCSLREIHARHGAQLTARRRHKGLSRFYLLIGPALLDEYLSSSNSAAWFLTSTPNVKEFAPMNRLACISVALGLAGAGSTAFAAEPQPMMMTDAQMDNVTGGGLIDVLIQDNLNNLAVNVNANVNATVNALVNTNVLVYAPVNVNVNALTGLNL